jgi:hypothetical protein
METYEASGESPKLLYFTKCCAEVLRGRYKKAVSVLERGIEKSLAPDEAIDGRELLLRVAALVQCVVSSLERDLGLRWRRSPKAPRPREIRCGFCTKRRNEVATMIAGTGGYICDACVKDCYRIVAEGVRDGATKKAAGKKKRASSTKKASPRQKT